uniref:Protein kinase domain-containing protein n=1 Tax=Chromera velia CCMP2878 TaxID=1169474 RepID=A0A0K6SA11_9ALVE|eukprot:Cvel_1335.t1-p1 / transcript=Cvel_1335.t1 / gene=Cvel_1335 / organism=Chromera_velia_CCMP2878 / gene_product=Calcium/calmodulin-dependent protein kinase type II, putative / transcript_product=Calcium/calmodulin-dependent protein kinase type II, putative / location=Cvel_scaffold45:155556-160423(+) / protein_length=733 / sequence_SO=supercontig / SO=protein_coding / is_pseudo=false
MQTALFRETEERAACEIQAAFRGFKGRKIAHSQRHMMVFRWPYNDPKSQVVVMGDFTKPAWGRQHRTAWCEARGSHVVELPLPPNDRVVQFKFIVDGRWVYDIKKPTIDDGQGNTNNLQTWGSDIAKDPFRAVREERKRLAAENRRQFLLLPLSQDQMRGQIELEVKVDGLKNRLQDAEKDMQAEKQRVMQVEETARNERETLQKSLQQAEAEKESLQTEMASEVALYTFPAEGGPPPGFPATFETSPAEISNGAAFFSPQVENSGGETDDEMEMKLKEKLEADAEAGQEQEDGGAVLSGITRSLEEQKEVILYSPEILDHGANGFVVRGNSDVGLPLIAKIARRTGGEEKLYGESVLTEKASRACRGAVQFYGCFEVQWGNLPWETVDDPSMKEIVGERGGGESVLALCLQFVGGETLERLHTKGALPLQDGLQIGLGLLETLEGLHKAGIAHCDLNMKNVKVDKEEKRWVVRVLDFGEAVEVGEHADPPSGPRGARAFQSPEMLSGDAVPPLTAATDLFPFGLILYALLTGKDIWEDAAERESLKRREAGEGDLTLRARFHAIAFDGLRPPIDLLPLDEYPPQIASEVCSVRLSCFEQCPSQRISASDARQKVGKILIKLDAHLSVSSASACRSLGSAPASERQGESRSQGSGTAPTEGPQLPVSGQHPRASTRPLVLVRVQGQRFLARSVSECIPEQAESSQPVEVSDAEKGKENDLQEQAENEDDADFW